MALLVLTGRILFSLIFILSGYNHFSSGAIQYGASQGVPAAQVLVPLSGVIALLGGLSIVTGLWARIGAWLIVLFLVPVTAMMHQFWAIEDPMAAQTQQAMFLKNLSMLGGALLIAYFGSGPLSLKKRGD